MTTARWCCARSAAGAACNSQDPDTSSRLRARCDKALRRSGCTSHDIVLNWAFRRAASLATAAMLRAFILLKRTCMAAIWKTYARLTLLAAALYTGGMAHAATPLSPPLAITVRFDFYPADSTRIHQLEQRLQRALQHARVGELGESEFHLDGNEGFFYLFGPDPQRLFAVAGPILQSSALMQHAEVEERDGQHRKTFLLQPEASR